MAQRKSIGVKYKCASCGEEFTVSMVTDMHFPDFCAAVLEGDKVLICSDNIVTSRFKVLINARHDCAGKIPACGVAQLVSIDQQ
jgi:hypothetical protein